MRFRLAYYDTTEENKFAAERRHEYVGNRDAIFNLWFMLTRTLGKKHVEVFNLAGEKQRPEDGVNGLCDYNI